MYVSNDDYILETLMKIILVPSHSLQAFQAFLLTLFFTGRFVSPNPEASSTVTANTAAPIQGATTVVN